MAAEKKGQTIVIKKIFINAGHHGGAWKVAFADFMTAMMAFFLVMWLLGQSDQTKKAVSDYFSTPSLIEYNFQNFGAEITLEKLFLDFVNEPLKAFQSFMEPMDRTPNLLDFGSERLITAFLADQLNDLIAGQKNLDIQSDTVQFDILDDKFFVPGTSTPNALFISSTEKILAATRGLEDATFAIEVRLFNQSVPDNDPEIARGIARERLEQLRHKIRLGLENATVDVEGSIAVADKKDYISGSRPPGMMRFTIRQKEKKADGRKPRKIDTLFGESDKQMDVYSNFVKQISESKTRSPADEPKK